MTNYFFHMNLQVWRPNYQNIPSKAWYTSLKVWRQNYHNHQAFIYNAIFYYLTISQGPTTLCPEQPERQKVKMIVTGMVKNGLRGVNKACLKFQRNWFGGVAAVLWRFLGNDSDRNA